MIESIKIAKELFSKHSHFPATELFNEGWMLRLVLDWYSKNSKSGDKLEFLSGSNWFSEAQLPTYFTKGNSIQSNEARTHADGVIGHFGIGEGKDKAGLSLNIDAEQFVVIEAKMSSGLSKGIRNDPNYNQVARSIACMAETTRLACINLPQLKSLAFYVLSPKGNKRIDSTFLDKVDIRNKVSLRFGNNNNPWLTSTFDQVLNQIIIQHITFEDLIDEIKNRDAVYGLDIEAFYKECLKHNGL